MAKSGSIAMPKVWIKRIKRVELQVYCLPCFNSLTSYPSDKDLAGLIAVWLIATAGNTKAAREGGF